MRSFVIAIRRTILSWLSTIGITLLFFACAYGTAVYVTTAFSIPDPGLEALIPALLFLLMYPLSIVLGASTVIVAGLISKQDLRLKWLPMFVLGSVIFCFGHLVFTDHASSLTVPPLLQPVFDNFARGTDVSGMYCMLYGGSMLIVMIFIGMRVSYLLSLLKLFLQIAVVIVPFALCIEFYFGGHDKGFWSLLALPAIVFAFVFFVFICWEIPFNFAHNVYGNMGPFFWLIYAIGAVLLITGLSLTLGNLFDFNILYHLVDTYLPSISYEISHMMTDVVGFLIGAGILAAGAVWLLSSLTIRGMRCSYCGRYAHEKITSTREISAYITGKHKVTTSTLTDIHIYSNGWHRDFYHDDETTYESVSYTNEESIECRYCKHDHGTRTHSGTYDKEISSRDLGDHSELRYL